jgi:hypothetical protein
MKTMIIGLLALSMAIIFFVSAGNLRADPASGNRTSGKYVAGSRVIISSAYHWAKGAVGTINQPPAKVREIAGDWKDLRRTVQGVKGPMTFYWVNFDVPQLDADGDGPFVGGEIDSAYFQTASSSSKHITLSEKALEFVWYENKKLGKRVEIKAFIKK